MQTERNAAEARSRAPQWAMVTRPSSEAVRHRVHLIVLVDSHLTFICRVVYHKPQANPTSDFGFVRRAASRRRPSRDAAISRSASGRDRDECACEARLRARGGKSANSRPTKEFSQFHDTNYSRNFCIVSVSIFATRIPILANQRGSRVRRPVVHSPIVLCETSLKPRTS